MGDLWLDRDGLQVLTIKAGKRNGSPPHLFYSPSFLQRLRESRAIRLGRFVLRHPH